MKGVLQFFSSKLKEELNMDQAMSEQLANNMAKSMIQGTMTYMNLENRCIGARLNPGCGKSLEMETRFATYQEKVRHLNNGVLRTVQGHFNRFGHLICSVCFVPGGQIHDHTLGRIFFCSVPFSNFIVLVLDS